MGCQRSASRLPALGSAQALASLSERRLCGPATYGHVQGDSCLKQIAEVAQNMVVRPGDLVARFGGEEFAVILPDTDSEGAIELAHEICEALRSRKLPHNSNPVGIMTVSAACATILPTRPSTRPNGATATRCATAME